MLQPNRSFSNGTSYRYGFNGKEKDNEVKGEGNQQDYGFRIYDPRLGRFLSVDPLTKSYPMLTPYQFGSNRPIDGIDLDGLEWSVETKSPNPNVTGGKHEVIYTIKISLADPKNTLSLTNENDKKVLDEMRTTAESILSNPNAVGSEKDPIVKVNIEFTSEDGPLKLLVRPFTGTVDENSKTKEKKVYGDPLANAMTKVVGNSQENQIDLATSFQFFFLKDGKLEFPTKPTSMDSKKFGRSLAHELGHTVGLYHPFDKENKIESLMDTPENAQTVKDNLLNSTGGGDNRSKEYKTNEGTKLITEQRKIIKETVTDQQKNKKNGN